MDRKWIILIIVVAVVLLYYYYAYGQGAAVTIPATVIGTQAAKVVTTQDGITYVTGPTAYQPNNTGTIPIVDEGGPPGSSTYINTQWGVGSLSELGIGGYLGTH